MLQSPSWLINYVGKLYCLLGFFQDRIHFYRTADGTTGSVSEQLDPILRWQCNGCLERICEN